MQRRSGGGVKEVRRPFDPYFGGGGGAEEGRRRGGRVAEADRSGFLGRRESGGRAAHH